MATIQGTAFDDFLVGTAELYDWLDTTRYGFVYRSRLRDPQPRTVPASVPGKTPKKRRG